VTLYSSSNDEATSPFKDVSINFINTSVSIMKEYLNLTSDEKSKYNTAKGVEIKKKISDKVEELHLKEHYGCSEFDYTHGAKSHNSIYQLVVGFPTSIIVLFYL
jgi:hypothetical protein